MTALTDPLHDDGPSAAYWTRVNAAEAVPGVPTPLGYSFWSYASEVAVDTSQARLGCLPNREIRRIVNGTDERVATIFHGRVVLNVDRQRWYADGFPGTSGDVVEQQFLGSVRPNVRSQPRYRRYPIVLAKAPAVLVRQSGQTARAASATSAWWRSQTRSAAHAERAEAAAMLREARERFRTVMSVHVLNAMIGTALVGGLYRSVGESMPDRFLQATGGLAGAERRLAGDLWRVARGHLAMEEFLDEFGFHAPDEGEISSLSWREDVGPLKVVLNEYASRGSAGSPTSRSDTVDLTRRCAIAEIIEAQPRSRRPQTRLLVSLIERFIPLRETSKASFLQCIDAGRAAGRRLGELDACAGSLSSPDDVWYLTVEEAITPPAEVADLVTYRRERRREYLRMSVPDMFNGVPEAIVIDDQPSEAPDGLEIQGLGVGSGVVTAPVRIVDDPRSGAFEPGEVLVAHTTDPAWAPLFTMASAVVTDVGGMMSHGAIVAREFGLPCVVNTGNASRRLKSGMIVTVDGTAGTVVVRSTA